MLIPLEPCGIILSNFVYICMSALSNHWHELKHYLITEHQSGRSWSVSGMFITLEPHIIQMVYLDQILHN